MAITPRCRLAAAYTVATVSPSYTTGWTNLGLGAAGTAPATGDIVFFISESNAANSVLSQTSGPTFTIQASNNNGGGTGMSTGVAWRVFDGTETGTLTFSLSGAGVRNNYSMIAIAPDAGSTISIDAWSTVKIDTTGATTHQANSATAASAGELPLILTGAIATATGVVTPAVTEPTGYTEAGLGATNGAASTKAGAADIAFSNTTTSGAGSVAPGAATMNFTCEANVYLVLVQETGAAAAIPDVVMAAN